MPLSWEVIAYSAIALLIAVSGILLAFIRYFSDQMTRRIEALEAWQAIQVQANTSIAVTLEGVRQQLTQLSEIKQSIRGIEARGQQHRKDDHERD